MPRKFFLKKNGKDIEIQDPNPAFTVEMVTNFFAPTYPELTTATVVGPIIEAGYVKYEFKTTVGTKG